MPNDLPPKSTVHDYLELWNWDGTLERIHHALYVAVREQEGREASPTVAIIDSQTAKGHSICCARHADCSPSSSASLPTVAMRERRWRSSCGAPGHGSWRL